MSNLFIEPLFTLSALNAKFSVNGNFGNCGYMLYSNNITACVCKLRVSVPVAPPKQMLTSRHCSICQLMQQVSTAMSHHKIQAFEIKVISKVRDDHWLQVELKINLFVISACNEGRLWFKHRGSPNYFITAPHKGPDPKSVAKQWWNIHQPHKWVIRWI